MTNDSIILSPGAHLSIQPPLKDVRVLVFGETGEVRLLLSTEPRQAIVAGPERPRGATTLAVDIDRMTAMKLLLGLHNLSNEMGWPLQQAVSSQAEFQRSVPQGPRRTPKGRGE